MGYDVHITRKKHWADDTGPEISLLEWVTYITSDRELHADRENPSPENAVYDGVKGPWPLWWHRGEVRTKNPTPEVIGKMVGIARALRAGVMGDEGEKYELDPKNLARGRQV